MHGKTPRRVSRERFIAEAIEAAAEIDRGGKIYRAEDVHRWLEQRSRGDKPELPQAMRSLSLRRDR